MNAIISYEDKPVLKKLYEAQVFTVDLAQNNEVLTIEEACDMCFRVHLTYDGLGQLIQELNEIRGQMVFDIPTLDSDPNLYTTGPDYDY